MVGEPVQQDDEEEDRVPDVDVARGYLEGVAAWHPPHGGANVGTLECLEGTLDPSRRTEPLDGCDRRGYEKEC